MSRIRIRKRIIKVKIRIGIKSYGSGTLVSNQEFHPGLPKKVDGEIPYRYVTGS
jgi:hypothetical protein